MNIGVGLGVGNQNAKVSKKSVTNFQRKIAGSLHENANVAKYAYQTTLQSPLTGIFGESEQTSYQNLVTLNGVLDTRSRNTNGIITQKLFSFNLLEYVKRKYGLVVSVDWLKANITKLTANWYGWGTSKMSQVLTGKTDFAGKVAGSVVENANNAFTRYLNILSSPSVTTGAVNWDNTHFPKATSLDGTTIISTTTTNGYQSQQIFSFNLIEYIKRKYGYTPTVDWLKANIQSVICNWHGKGSSPTGNKATLVQWYAGVSTPVWGAATSHTNANISKLISQIGVQHIDVNGIVYFLAYADPSNGTIASTIETDFVELEVTLKDGVDKATLDVYSTNWGNTPITNTTNVVSKSSKVLFSPTLNGMIQSDGSINYLVYSEPSNGIAPSTINTDYIELEIELKNEYVER